MPIRLRFLALISALTSGMALIIGNGDTDFQLGDAEMATH